LNSIFSMRLSFLLILALAFVACSKPKSDTAIATKDTATVASGPLSVHTLLTRTRDSSLTPQDTTHIFSPKDTIHGVIHSNNAREGMVLIGRWFYTTSGQKVAENSTRLAAGPNISYFDLMNETPWPVGDYKLLILVDSAVVDSAQFAVGGKR
jgi:hypothetical protein